MTHNVLNGSLSVEGLRIAYRQAGDPAGPKLVLLHGFPASSHLYRNLISRSCRSISRHLPRLSRFREQRPARSARFPYTFDRLSEITGSFLKAKSFDRYGLFVQDYGGPVGFRIVAREPQALE